MDFFRLKSTIINHEHSVVFLNSSPIDELVNWCLRHNKGVSMATLRAGPTPACSRQLAPSHWKNSPDPVLTNTQKGWKPESAKIRLRSLSNRLRNAGTKCNVSQKKWKRPLRSPHRSRTLEDETADRIGLQFKNFTSVPPSRKCEKGTKAWRFKFSRSGRG